MAEQRVDFRIAASEAATAVFKKVESGLKGLSDAYGKLQGLSGALGVGFITQQITSNVIQAERAAARLDAVLKSTGNSAGITRAELDNIAESLKGGSVFDDDEIRKGLASLLRFKEVQGDVFRDAAKLGPDLATALDTDLVGAYTRLGRALQDPATGMRALREAGVKLNDQQAAQARSLAETGDKAAAAKIVIDELTKSVGGVAGAENSGLYGATKNVQKAWDDLMKGIGVGENAVSRLNRIAKAIEFITPGGKKEKVPSGADIGRADLARAASESEQAQEAARRGILSRVEIAQGPLTKIVTDREKELADKRLQILDIYHQDGVQSERDYYEQRRQIIGQNASAETKLLNAQIGAAQFTLDNKADLTQEDRIRGEVQLKQLVEQRAKVQRDASQQYVVLALQEQKAADDFEDSLKEVNIRLLEAAGRTTDAANARFNLQNQNLRKRIRANFGPDSPEEANLDKLRDQLNVTEMFNREQLRGEQIQQRLANREAEVESSRRTGAITDLEAMRRISDARQKAVVDLKDVSSALDDLAKNSDDPRLQVAAETFRARLAELAGTADLVGERFRTVLVDPITDFLDAAVLKTKKLSDAFKDMARDIVQQMIHLQNQSIAQTASGYLAKGIGALFGGLFGGGSSGSDAAYQDGLLEAAGFRASGGPVMGGSPYIVGEQGPELFVPGSSGTIVANDRLGAMGGDQVNIYFSANTPAAVRDAVLAMAPSIQAGAVSAVREGRRRGRG